MINDTFERTMLFDFYGDMLTDKQREYFDLHYNEDLSLAEIAEQGGISRQGVWDIIRRAELTLREVEEKIGLVRRFSERRRVLAELEADLGRLLALTEGEARALTGQITEKLRELER